MGRRRKVESMEPPGEKPLWGKCPKCGHCWAVAYLPMMLDIFAKLAKGHARCPKCATPGVVAKQDDGVLLETV